MLENCASSLKVLTKAMKCLQPDKTQWKFVSSFPNNFLRMNILQIMYFSFLSEVKSLSRCAVVLSELSGVVCAPPFWPHTLLTRPYFSQWSSAISCKIAIQDCQASSYRTSTSATTFNTKESSRFQCPSTSKYFKYVFNQHEKILQLYLSPTMKRIRRKLSFV